MEFDLLLRPIRANLLNLDPEEGISGVGFGGDVAGSKGEILPAFKGRGGGG